MRKFFVIGTIILAIVLILGVATNPSYGDYKEWYKQQAQEGFIEYKEGEETTEFEKSVMSFFADMITDTSIVREDFKIYSLYTSTDNNYKVLGIFNRFYILEEAEQK